MKWIKAITSGITGDKQKDMGNPLRCPYFSCPSNQPFVGSRPPKMKLLGRVQPYVYEYECRYCGFKTLYGAEGDRIPDNQRAHLLNKNLLYARK